MYPNPFSTNPQPQQSPQPSRVARLQQIFGIDTVMVPTKWGTKEPFLTGYPEFTIAKMSDPQYLALLESHNIAILTGPPSGGLNSIDFDDNAAAVEFRKHNPELARSIISKGARGCNLWLRIDGEYPIGVVKLVGPAGESLGEWRAGGGITVVDGRHPSGQDYAIYGNGHVVGVRFDQINWPEEWKNYPGRTDPFAVLVERHGPPFINGPKGGHLLNESFVVAWILSENELTYALENRSFYRYDEESGIWILTDARVVGRMIHGYLERLAQHNGNEALHIHNRSTVVTSIRKGLEAKAAEKMFSTRGADTIALFAAANTVVRVEFPNPLSPAGGISSCPYLPDYRFVAKSVVSYVPGAECPRFLNEVLAPVLDPDDIELLLMLCGLVLLGENRLQKIIVLEGDAGSGKGVAVRCLCAVLGPGMTTELRTKHLDGRFETSRYAGKRLLVGNDVASDFLSTAGASMLKALTGGDTLSTESKGGNVPVDLEGNFHVIITGNAELRVRLDSDGDAWLRRLAIFRFRRQPESPRTNIMNFDRLLIATEGSGILNLLLHYGRQALFEIRQYGEILVSDAQRKRVEDRVRASDTLGAFVADRLQPADQGQVTSAELWSDYVRFCAEQEWAALPQRSFHKRLKEELSTRYGQAVTASENVTHNQKRGRGYRGVVLMPHPQA